MRTAVLCRNFSNEVSHLVAQQEKYARAGTGSAEGERIERVGTDGLKTGAMPGNESGIGG
jgi:hypothetical protein